MSWQKVKVLTYKQNAPKLRPVYIQTFEALVLGFVSSPEKAQALSLRCALSVHCEPTPSCDFAPVGFLPVGPSLPV